MQLPASPLFPVYVLLALAVLGWNLTAASRIIRHRRAPRPLALTTALGALLLIPALVVAVASTSLIYGRAIQPIAWVWPIVATLFVLQAALAIARQLVNPFFGVPVLVYDAIIATVAWAHYLSTRGVEPPEFARILSAAHANALGVVAGSAALAQAAWILVPLLSPALPSRSRLKRALRVIIAFCVTVVTSLIVIDVPSAVEAVRSYGRYERAMLQERPAGDLDIGLAVFPTLTAAPPRIAISSDLAVADSLGVDAIAVTLTSEGARGRAFDSLARVLDDYRDENTTVIVTLVASSREREQADRNPAAYVEARLTDVNRIARTLKPNIFLPIDEPYGAAEQAIGARAPEFWTDYLERASRIIHYVNPNIRVGVAAASYGTRDSILYAWAARRGSPVDLAGFALRPGFAGATSLDTHLRIAQRWMRQFPRPKAHWVWSAGGYPITHGETSQTLALSGILSWATAQPAIHGIVITQAGDYETQRGLRTPTGRLRPAFGMLARDIVALRETATH